MVALLLFLLAAPTPPLTTVELRPVVAMVDGAPVVDTAWLEARVARANAIFAPYGLAFHLGPITPLTAPVDALTRAERDALAPQVQRGVVNVFIVRRLLDIHKKGLIRRGVHWHAGGRHYVILASYASETVPAHELGHFFGNPQHRHQLGNLMGYIPGLGLPRLEPDQAQRLHAALRRFLRTGELRALPEE
ncbi:MAG: hypothetical protein KC620_13000 [Myxococcales bacterium]|nr:hypothetical protein [Myxococcales bacterium]